MKEQRIYLEGYTINKKQLVKNYQKFQNTLKEIQTLLPENKSIPAKEVLDLINVFARAWFSLEAYDKENFPDKGWTKKQVSFTAEELSKDWFDFAVVANKSKKESNDIKKRTL